LAFIEVTNVQMAEVIVMSVIPAAVRNATASGSHPDAYQYGFTKKLTRKFRLTLFLNL
jgi:hypothetical protein